jgi:hypothetical protein
MKSQLKERLKDIIIDHVYDYCFNEVVMKIEGGGNKIELGRGSKVEDDPFMQVIHENIKKSGEYKAYYDKRNKKYCKIIEGKNIFKSFTDKLVYLGFEKSDTLHLEINEAIQFLLHRSYLSHNQPIESEYSLTDKGLNHYLTGASFEDKYLQNQDSHQTRLISVISLVVAIAAILLQFIIS